MAYSINEILTLVSAFLVIFLGGFVLLNDRNNKSKLVFFLLSLVFSGWIFGTFMLFISDSIEEVFVWDKFIYSFVVFIPAFLYHFVFRFTDKGNKYVLYIAYFLSIFFIITVLSTNSFIGEVFVYKWGMHMKAQLFHHWFLFVFFVFLLESYRLLFLFCRESKGNTRKQAMMLLLGFFVLGAVGSLGFLPAYQINIYPFSHFSALFFVMAISYAISRYNLLGVKVFAIYFLIIALNMVAFTHIFISKSFVEYIVEIVSFVLVLMISYLLGASFRKEVKQREHLERVSKSLQKANKKLANTAKKLKVLDKAKNEFLSVAAHQLRTPATAIKGYTSMILEGTFGKCDDSVMDVLRKVCDVNERMTALIEDLLTTSRIESGYLKYEFAKANIQDILEELNNTFTIRAKESKLNFSIKYPQKDPLPEVVVDKNKIREVISNIIDNAIKYTPKGNIKVTAEKVEEFIKISVKDTGRGMTERTKKNLFEKFTRGRESASDVEGTGLGLFVVKNYVEKHGGTISAYSDGLGKGSEFVIKLPINGAGETEL